MHYVNRWIKCFKWHWPESTSNRSIVTTLYWQHCYTNCHVSTHDILSCTFITFACWMSTTCLNYCPCLISDNIKHGASWPEFFLPATANIQPVFERCQFYKCLFNEELYFAYLESVLIVDSTDIQKCIIKHTSILSVA